jgi:hypothetical protein
MGSGNVLPDVLAAQIRALLDDAEARRGAAAFGRRMAVTRYGLPQTAGRLEDICREAVKERPSRARELAEASRILTKNWAARTFSPKNRRMAAAVQAGPVSPAGAEIPLRQ